MMLSIIIPSLIFLALLFKFFVITNPQKTKNVNLYPPEPSGARPIIGHLQLLSNKVHLARTLSNLADKYGPIFTLRLGMQRAVVVSSREAVMECFTTNDKSFLNRPRSSAGEYLVYDHASFGFANGAYWREMRKLVMLEVLSPRRLEAMRDLRVSEIDTSIRELYRETLTERNGTSSKLIVMSRWIEQVALNIIVKTIAGIRYENDERGTEGQEAERFKNIFRELTFLSGEFVLSDVIPVPFLKWLDVQGYIKRMKHVSKELDVIIEEWINEHVRRRAKGGKQDEKDFIDVLLSTIDEKFDSYGPSRLTIIKATVVNVVLGGFDTTSVFFSWLLSLLVNHKNVMKLAQEEIDTKIGKERWVQESDIKNLPYLQAIIKEGLRLYPPLPMSIPHEAVEDCRLNGYLIPKGTLIFVNLLKLHQDPRFWSEPSRFMPERFLTSNAKIDVTGQQFEYTPFGTGRRACPGTAFAMQVTSTTIARLLQGFDFATPGDDPVDMSEGLGITMPRAKPLEIRITSRLDSQLFEK